MNAEMGGKSWKTAFLGSHNFILADLGEAYESRGSEICSSASDNRVTTSGTRGDFCQGFAIPTEPTCYHMGLN
jgi:hypothetical protein